MGLVTATAGRFLWPGHLQAVGLLEARPLLRPPRRKGRQQVGSEQRASKTPGKSNRSNRPKSVKWDQLCR